MVPRLASAMLGLPVLLAAIWYGSYALSALVAVLAVLAVREFCGLATGAGTRPYLLVSTVIAIGLVVNGHLGGAYTVPVLALGLGASLVWATARGLGGTPLPDWALTLAGSLYVGVPLSLALLIRAGPQGREWLLLTMMATFATDAGAYLVGRLVGRRQLAPAISPGKTWEGAAGGLAAGVASTPALALLLELPVDMWAALLAGAAIGVAAQVGDLTESLFKRAAGAKEAGGLIPGHGGVLDRLDSVVFTLVVMYHLAQALL